MPTRISKETELITYPNRYAVNKDEKLLTPIKGDPPMFAGRGRRRNPLITKMYNQLITSRNQWFHVNIPITSKEQLASIRTSLYARASKDNFTISTSSLFNDVTKTYDLWVMLG